MLPVADALAWVLTLQVAWSGQLINLEVASESECRAKIAAFALREANSVTIDIGKPGEPGLVVPIARGIACKPKSAPTAAGSPT